MKKNKKLILLISFRFFRSRKVSFFNGGEGNLARDEKKGKMTVEEAGRKGGSKNG